MYSCCVIGEVCPFLLYTNDYILFSASNELTKKVINFFAWLMRNKL
jgi:hypothetical protein